CFIPPLSLNSISDPAVEFEIEEILVVMKSIWLAVKKSLILAAIVFIVILVRKDALLAVQQNPNTNSSQRHVSRRVLVKFRPGTDPKRIDSLIAQGGASSEGQIAGLGIHILHVGSAGAEEAVARAFANRPEVEFAEPDGLVEPDRIPN